MQRRAGQRSIIEAFRTPWRQRHTDPERALSLVVSFQAVSTDTSIKIRPKILRLDFDGLLEFGLGTYKISGAKMGLPRHGVLPCGMRSYLRHECLCDLCRIAQAQ